MSPALARSPRGSRARTPARRCSTLIHRLWISLWITRLALWITSAGPFGRFRSVGGSFRGSVGRSARGLSAGRAVDLRA